MGETRDLLLRKGDYVFGSFVKPERVDGYINAVNPGDRSDVLGRFPFSEASTDEALEVAQIGFRTWRRVTLNDRVTIIKRFRDGLNRAQERLARLMTRETGRPLWETRQEVVASARAIDLFLDEGVAALSPRVIDEIGARSDRLPRGVAAILAPYTFPLLTPTTQVAAALLAGCSVVFKPSKYTPGTGQCIADLIDHCRLPRGTFNLVQGPGSVIGQRIVSSPNIDLLLFSGSYATAQAIRQATSGRPELPMVLQTGGKGMAVVLEDAELDRAVYEVMVGAFLSAGQRHTSTARVFVHERLYPAFVENLVRRSRQLTLGYGMNADTFLGPLISEAQRNRYRRFSRALLAAGHEALLEAAQDTPEGRKGFYARPAIFRVAWERGNPFLDDEPPGPVLLVYRVSGWEEAADLHNQAAFRGATSVFSRLENPVLYELKDRLRTGTLNINRATIGASLRMPSVGLGRSSNGASAGIDLLAALTSPRAQLIESRPFDQQMKLPGTQWGDDEDTTLGTGARPGAQVPAE